VLSVAAWLPAGQFGAYHTAKAAAWMLTNCVRLELAAQNTLVTGVVLGPTDTDMAAGADIPKNDPAHVVRAVLDGIEAGRAEVTRTSSPRSPRPTSPSTLVRSTARPPRSDPASSVAPYPTPPRAMPPAQYPQHAMESGVVQQPAFSERRLGACRARAARRVPSQGEGV
jgi:NAD(P)-dependent dehydrogenase (short-subunit alcohol dehydrogenase family)